VTARVLALKYAAASEVIASPTAARVALSLECGRKVGVTGRINDPELFRDAFLTAIAVRDSDLRYKGRDRAAYLAFLMKKGKKATKAIWEAQKSFLDSAFADETPRPRGLDPIVTVDPDEVSLEVFSRDESAYARLGFDNALFDGRTAAHGTSVVDLAPELAEQVERIRTYQPLDLEAETQPKKPRGEAVSREIELPDEWLRGFLQVQSAATLPGTVLELTPVDFYNILFTLRTRRAKKAPRGLRFELVPGTKPRVVIEPWEIALEAHGATYEGREPRIVRIYGRQRLLCLARALPHLKKVRIHLLGAGLPSFWVLDMGRARMTVALTSWAESKWGSAASFDQLMPRADDGVAVDAIVAALAKSGPLALPELAAQVGASQADARAALQRACLRGQVLFDRDRNVFRPRAILEKPVDERAIRFGSPREASAHRFLEAGDSVKITKLHLVAGEGTEISGEVEDKQARRSFSPRFSADPEGQVKDAWCNCPTFQRSAMREGPCEHMIALFVFQKRAAAAAERLRLTPEGRKLVRAETRTLVQRDASGKQTRYRVTLDDRVVRVEASAAPSGQPLGEPRFQRLWFDTDAEARDAYFARLDRLASEGFIDTEALSA
jgi:hypothetical protein